MDKVFVLLLIWSSLFLSCLSYNGTIPNGGNHVSDNYNGGGIAVKPYIVGGEEAQRHEFPWLVWLASKNGYCGGALIAMDMVLTAAHCVYKLQPRDVTVVAGDHDTDDIDGNEQMVGASSVVWHKDYVNNQNSPYFLQNDIALIRLERNVTLTNAVQTIELPPANYDVGGPTNPRGTVAGWGATSQNNQQRHRYLLKVDVPIIRNTNECPEPVSNTNTQFCAGDYQKDSCQGDSGGPFICHDLPGHVCGIVSGGVGCGQAGYPGMYQKVSAFRDWIDRNSAFTLSPHLMLIFATNSVLLFISKFGRPT